MTIHCTCLSSGLVHIPETKVFRYSQSKLGNHSFISRGVSWVGGRHTKVWARWYGGTGRYFDCTHLHAQLLAQLLPALEQAPRQHPRRLAGCWLQPAVRAWHATLTAPTHRSRAHTASLLNTDGARRGAGVHDPDRGWRLMLGGNTCCSVNGRSGWCYGCLGNAGGWIRNPRLWR